MSALRPQGWMRRWGLPWGWRSLTDTRSTASTTAFKGSPTERWRPFVKVFVKRRGNLVPVCPSAGVWDEMAQRGRMDRPGRLTAGNQTVNNQRLLMSCLSICLLNWMFFVFFFRTLPQTNMEKIVENIVKYNISALLVIGGFEVKLSRIALVFSVCDFVEFCRFSRGMKVCSNCTKPAATTMSSASPCVSFLLPSATTSRGRTSAWGQTPPSMQPWRYVCDTMWPRHFSIDGD